MTLTIAMTVRDGHAEVSIARRYTGHFNEDHSCADKLCDVLEPAIYEAARKAHGDVFKTAIVRWDGELFHIPPEGQTKEWNWRRCR